jgi:hypothetical protein
MVEHGHTCKEIVLLGEGMGEGQLYLSMAEILLTGTVYS